MPSPILSPGLISPRFLSPRFLSPGLLSPGLLSPRPIFDPVGADGGAGGGAAGGSMAGRGDVAAVTAGPGRRGPIGALVEFYRDRLSWLVLGATSAILCYLGGLVMFWFHAIELGEGGPAISWYAHWLLDSTVAFVALTPALAVIIPLAIHWTSLVTGWTGATAGGTGATAGGTGATPGAARQRIVLVTYAVIAGGLFAVVTVPGPVVHNTFVGRGTWLADRVTTWIGDPSASLAPAEEYSLSALLSQQLGAAVASYLLLTLLSVVLIRWLLAVAARRPAVNVDATGPGPCND